jgi:hypothetical protein
LTLAYFPSDPVCSGFKALFYIAFPKAEDDPTGTLKSRSRSVVSGYVASKLVSPIVDVGILDRDYKCGVASFPKDPCVPIVAVNEDSHFLRWKRYVGLTREKGRVLSKAKAPPMEELAQCPLRLVLLGADCRHVAGDFVLGLGPIIGISQCLVLLDGQVPAPTIEMCSLVSP